MARPGGKREARGTSGASASTASGEERPASGAGESFEEAARRETREETGLDCEVTGLLAAHVTELVDETDPERATLYSLIAIFTGRPRDGDPTPRPREGEIAAVDWFDAPPETVGYPEVAERPFPASE
ncbi:MAG: NUDIX hydrolase [Haloarculaceae archaeon]